MKTFDEYIKEYEAGQTEEALSGRPRPSARPLCVLSQWEKDNGLSQWQPSADYERALQCVEATDTPLSCELAEGFQLRMFSMCMGEKLATLCYLAHDLPESLTQ